MSRNKVANDNCKNVFVKSACGVCAAKEEKVKSMVARFQVQSGN